MTDLTPLPAPPESIVPTKYWHQLEHGRIQCDMCPRTHGRVRR